MRRIIKRINLDRRNPAGGIGEGQRTVRRGGWLKFGDDLFYAEGLEAFAGERVFICNLESAFSPHGRTMRGLPLKPVHKSVNGEEVSADFIPTYRAGTTIETYYTLEAGAVG
jgi:hypothetical protein